jgi:hypothetical protein
MAEEVEAPVTGGKVDPSDPSGSAVSIVMAMLGLVLAGGIVTGATLIWNALASRTPDTVPEAEVFFA